MHSDELAARDCPRPHNSALWSGATCLCLCVCVAKCIVCQFWFCSAKFRRDARLVDSGCRPQIVHACMCHRRYQLRQHWCALCVRALYTAHEIKRTTFRNNHHSVCEIVFCCHSLFLLFWLIWNEMCRARLRIRNNMQADEMKRSDSAMQYNYCWWRFIYKFYETPMHFTNKPAILLVPANGANAIVFLFFVFLSLSLSSLCLDFHFQFSRYVYLYGCTLAGADGLTNWLSAHLSPTLDVDSPLGHAQFALVSRNTVWQKCLFSWKINLHFAWWNYTIRGLLEWPSKVYLYCECVEEQHWKRLWLLCVFVCGFERCHNFRRFWRPRCDIALAGRETGGARHAHLLTYQPEFMMSSRSADLLIRCVVCLRSQFLDINF